MRRFIFLVLAAVATIGVAQAYIVNIEAPKEITVGVPLKVLGTTTFPAGYGLDVVLSRSQYTSSEIARRTVAVDTEGKFSVVFDTLGLDGGQYKVEARIPQADASKLGSSSNTILLVDIVDRSKELHVTSPLRQDAGSALLVEGYINKIGNNGVELTVLGPQGKIFGEFIATKAKPGYEDGDGTFSKRIPVFEAGNYLTEFRDSKGYIGSTTFVVSGPPATALPTTTLPSPTTDLQTAPQPTKSPAPAGAVIGALGLIGACAVLAGRKDGKR